MFSKLTFGQKLAVWLGFALAIVIASIIAISIQMAKNPPRDVEQFFNNELFRRSYFSDYDWAKREREATAELEKNSKSAYWYAERAKARWFLDNNDGAKADFSRAIELDPNDSDSLVYRATLHKFDGNYKEALADSTRAIAVAPKNGWSYLTRAEIYREQYEYDEALKDIEQCLKTNYDKRDVYSEKAEIYKSMQRYDKAIEALERAVEFKKSHSSDDCYDGLVQLYIIAGRLKEAQAACGKWIEESRPTNNTFTTCANVSKALGDKESETAAYKKYLLFLTQKIADHPTKAKNYETRGTIYDKIGEPEKARYDYLDYLESSNLKPEHGIFDPKVLLKFGKLFDRVGQTEKKNELYSDAIERFTAKLKVSPKDARLYSYRAQIYAAQNNLKTAAKDFETAGKLKHSNAETIAWAEFALINKQYELASKLALELIEADVTNELIFQASVFEALGAHKEALRLASDALKQDPFLPAAYYWIGKARAGLGEKEEAARKLQQATALGYDPEASLFEDQNEDDDDDE